MAKTTAWLVTLIGLIYTLKVAGLSFVTAPVFDWLIALSFLAIGITKLIRNYSYKK